MKAAVGDALRLWHTVRFLRAEQIYGRAWHRLYHPKPRLGPAPDLRQPVGAWRQSAARRPSMIRPDAVVLLNQPGQIAEAADWDRPDRDLLWRYNLHYFDDLNALDAPQRQAWHSGLIARWIAENPPARGVGWHPYPLSLRIVNWLKAHLAGRTLAPDAIASLAVQSRALAGRLERHLLGNHLFANAKALVFAGTGFEGSEADQWRRAGLSILAREVPEQILPDGGHFERSPMYHALILEDLLDLLNLDFVHPGVLPETQVAEWRGAADLMQNWLAAMVHPDGDIAFFNDAAFGVAPPCPELSAYAARLGLPAAGQPEPGVSTLPDSGYVRVAGPTFVALLDVAPIGPDYLPGHAHADTLSFELSLFGQRTIVNSGTSLYGTSPERLRQRSTAAHSTVEVDGQNSSEVWSGFRVARRARPIAVRIANRQSGPVVSGAHTGYLRLNNGVKHTREWRFGEATLSVVDRLDGQFGTAVQRVFLHPDVEVDGNGRSGLLTLRGGEQVSWTVEGGEASPVEATWHPEFGLSQPNRCLAVRFSGPSVALTLEW